MMGVEQGFLAVVALLILIALRFPIGLSLATVAFSGIALFLGFGPALSYVGRIPREFATQYEFSAIRCSP
ncbi:hypothetical protein WG622_16080 [Cognatishimia sp. D5M38]|jgi:hypothetical protein|uniref:TRAP C4-dicarboxylate transport system permease DctM subunit domain-containing protein n=1 Tax=Cognatishimia coralii TaxID=3083254 RepID=A0ABU8QK21_9RHOB|nr:hypothetical protein [Sulfitobacter sp. PR48]MDD9722817.1 hypothetical protein [Sulfitobacter sp. PR48]